LNYQKLFPFKGITNVGLIGTGPFGASFLAQARLVPGIRVPVVCDRELDVAEKACLQAGMVPSELEICCSAAETNAAIASGKTAIVSDAMLLMVPEIEAMIEASGMPEAGALHARAAIENGKHVVMVTKEADCVVGPILSRLAQNAGTVYTPADGDQPSLLIGLIVWAEMLGFDVVCAGKAAELDFVYERESKTISRGEEVAAGIENDLWELPGGAAEQAIGRRRRSLASLSQFSVADLCEMAIVINATGYDYDAPQLHAPIVRIIEMPEIMCDRVAGGIFQKEGVIDMVNCLRRPDEISFAGGVFVIVKCQGRQTWQLLKEKGHLVSRDGSRAMIFRPYHLLGVETATSVLAAHHLELSTLGPDPRPRVDVGARTMRRLPAGRSLSMGHDHAIAGLMPEILPAMPMASGSPVPYYLAAGHQLKHDVEEGTLLTYAMIDHDGRSGLWKLRWEQNELFGMRDRLEYERL
jgi:predicted homoserine dehydrogenase-like protein